MLEQIQQEITECKACPLHDLLPQGCSPISGFGIAGNLMFIGEAPGENEIELGRPFVGLAGRLLDQILKDSGIDKNSIYIANTVNCRPHDYGKNRPPTKLEIATCKHWLWKQIQAVNPTRIFTLGMTPTKTLLHDILGKTFKLKDVIGNEYRPDFLKCPVVPIYHPSYLLQYGRAYTTKTISIIKNYA
jgi:uracil-DNA glycosylase